MSERKPRFLQLVTWYPTYLDDFYASRPELTGQSYAKQIDALLDDGFSDTHMYCRLLEERGWDTLHVVANCAPVQKAWLEENNETAGSILEIVQKQVTAFQPDVFYTTNVQDFDSTFTTKLTPRPAVISGWRGFPVEPPTDLSDYDLILTSFDRVFHEAGAIGAKHIERFHPGFPADHPVAAEPRDIRWDVVFSGSVTPRHLWRIRIINHIAQLSRDPDHGFSFGLFMADASPFPEEVQRLNQGAVWAHDMYRTLRSAKVVVNVDIDAFANQPPNMRLIEATGAGTCLLTPFHPQLEEFFEPGKEVETFRNENELFSKLQFLLANPDQAAEIAAAGQARCLKDHALKDRADWFERLMSEALDRAGLSF